MCHSRDLDLPLLSPLEINPQAEAESAHAQQYEPFKKMSCLKQGQEMIPDHILAISTPGSSSVSV
jgi:hypothetical protein